MKIMEKAKRFFTLNAAKHEGFTLVELIVVIAILAILAGVAVPAYSGYIEKSKRAGDETLLAAVNKAFASACLANNKDVYEIENAAVIMENGIVKGISVPADYSEDFMMFYEGNTESAFQVIKSLAFDSIKHMFVDPTVVGVTVSYKGNYLVVDGTAIQAYKDSNWGEVATGDVLGLVGSVTDFASVVDNDTFNAMLADDNYNDACAEALGYASTDEYKAAIEKMVTDYATANPDGDVDAYEKNLIANTAVLVAAQNASANKDSILGTLTANGGADAKTSIKNAMANSPADGLAQASIAYGLYTSYQLSLNPSYDTTKNPNPLDVLNTLEDDGFQKYLNSDAAKSDLDGFVGALDTVSGNTGNGVGADIVQNGFADNDDLAVLMQQLMGN